MSYPTPVALPEQVSGSERNLAMIAHLAGLFSSLGLCILVPVVILFTKGDESAFVNGQCKEALNFQLTVFLLSIPLVLLCFVLIGIPFLAALWLAEIVFSIVAAVRVSDGISYRYPFCLRLLR